MSPLGLLDRTTTEQNLSSSHRKAYKGQGMASRPTNAHNPRDPNHAQQIAIQHEARLCVRHPSSKLLLLQFPTYHRLSIYSHLDTPCHVGILFFCTFLLYWVLNFVAPFSFSVSISIVWSEAAYPFRLLQTLTDTHSLSQEFLIDSALFTIEFVVCLQWLWVASTERNESFPLLSGQGGLGGQIVT